MIRDPLERLVDAAQGLPQLPALETDASGPDEVAGPRGLDRRRRGARASAQEFIDSDGLRTRVRELIAELARRTDEALPATLARADIAWDQIDALRIIDAAVEQEAHALRRAAAALETAAEASDRALGLEARLTVDAAVDLVALVERRLATLVRLRLRTATVPTDDSPFLAPLLPGGKPFLDLGAALHEAARRWV